MARVIATNVLSLNVHRNPGTVERLSASRSGQLQDPQVAPRTAASQVLQQGSTAATTQANGLPKNVLSLFR